MNNRRNTIKLLIFTTLLIIGIFLRFYKISFGLPYNFIGDETDIYDAVIKFSLNYKFMLEGGNIQDFAPNSYVYGMFPTYLLTLLTMFLNKLASIFTFHIDFNFYHIYMRVMTATLSLLIPLFTYLIYKEIFKKTKGSLMTLFLTLINWSLIVYSRYLNQDIFLTILFTGSIFFLLKYLGSKGGKASIFYLTLSSILLGFAIGTKITALISLPVTIGVIYFKGRFKDIFVFSLGAVLAFSISNPFSIINFSSFVSRVISMKTREAGVVFSSVDENPLKYLTGLSSILTPTVFVVSLVNIIISLKEYVRYIKFKTPKFKKLTHFLLIGNFFTYLLFFTLNKRLVERWMLPIIPILCIYASNGIQNIGYLVKDKKKQLIFEVSLTAIFVISYFFNALIIYRQIKYGDTRVMAYEWARSYLKEPENAKLKILVYTNKGRDPFTRIDRSEVKLFEVYESKDAEKFFPIDPKNYDIIVTYSGMEKNYKNPYVKENYPKYSDSWISFENELKESENFNLIKSFETTEKNLIGLSNIYIYKKLER